MTASETWVEDRPGRRSGPKASRPQRPIIVLGFGRSGTTWVADILSKVLGGIILFEPFHPLVAPDALRMCYSSPGENLSPGMVFNFLQSVLAKELRHPWLLRNHLPMPTDRASEHLLSVVWDSCEVLGFKDIRANFMIEWLVSALEARIVFVVRHPCEVAASLLRRQNFWEEFGWSRHCEAFAARLETLGGQIPNGSDWRSRLASETVPLPEKYAIMWGVTHAIALPVLRRQGLPHFHYEDIYLKPFEETQRMLSYLGEPEQRIHPWHLLAPSNTATYTYHGDLEKEEELRTTGFRMFWQDVIDREREEAILTTVQDLGVEEYSEDGLPSVED